MAITSIVTDQQVLDWVGLETPSQTQSESLSRLRLTAEKAVRRYVGATLTQGTYTHYLPKHERNATYILRTPEWPVRSITSIYLNHAGYFGQAPNAFPESTLLTAGVHYCLTIDRGGMSMFGHIMRIGSQRIDNKTLWPMIPGSVKVTYVAGFTSAELSGDATVDDLNPAEIATAVLITVGARWNMLKNKQSALKPGDVQSESLEGWSQTLAVQPTDKDMAAMLPDDAKDLLQPYVRRSI